MSEELAFGAHIPSGELQNEYLSFWADRQLFAVPIREVRQIIRMQKIVEVPDYPPYARGIINLRGDIIPIIDVRMRLGKPEIPYNDRTCIIIIDVGGHQYGIVVDQVSEVMEITKQQFSQPFSVRACADVKRFQSLFLPAQADFWLVEFFQIVDQRRFGISIKTDLFFPGLLFWILPGANRLSAVQKSLPPTRHAPPS